MNQKLNCIMLIDDDEPTNFLSSMLVEESNCTEHIQVEDSAEGALEYLVNSKESLCIDKECPWPDLIFLDINMPAMNGFEFLEKYQELNKTVQKKVVIVMLTTSINPDDKTKACNIPVVSGFEIKPLTTELLDKVITKYFSSHLHNQVSEITT